jgi:hypothetical protein
MHAPVLQGFGRSAKPGAKRQIQGGVAGWPAIVSLGAEQEANAEGSQPSAISPMACSVVTGL